MHSIPKPPVPQKRSNTFISSKINFFFESIELRVLKIISFALSDVGLIASSGGRNNFVPLYLPEIILIRKI